MLFLIAVGASASTQAFESVLTYFAEEMTWLDAHNFCQSLGGRLPEPRSRAENDAVRDAGGVWLGARDVVLEVRT